MCAGNRRRHVDRQPAVQPLLQQPQWWAASVAPGRVCRERARFLSGRSECSLVAAAKTRRAKQMIPLLPALAPEMFRRPLVRRLDSGERQLSGTDSKIKRQTNSFEIGEMCFSRKLILGSSQTLVAGVFEDYSLEDEGKLKRREWYETFPCGGGLRACGFKGDAPWRVWIPA